MAIEWTQFDALPGITIRVVADQIGVRAIELNPTTKPEGARQDDSPLLQEAVRQLRAYFAGELRRFDLPLALHGTDFQKRVWRELTAIPYGETRSYAQIAAAIGSSRAVRAVGAANGSNPIAIVVPCHRVIGADGRLVGYGGGLPVKKLLLDLEAQYAHGLRKAAPG